MLTFSEIDLTFGESANDVKAIGFPAVEEYLRKRGIAAKDMRALDLRIVPAQQLKQMTLKHQGVMRMDDRLAVVIPHYDFENKPIDWWSARMVQTGPVLVTSFAHVVGPPKGKMICPPHEPPHAYLPPITKWKFENGARVYIHESAIKAINGAKAGGLHVGLNGVWGWTSRHHDIALVSELRSIPWKARELQPVIVFDSNWDDNDQVRLAIGRLGAKIQELTGRVAIHLPVPRAADGSHQGFDDFCQGLTEERVRDFLSGEGQPIELGSLELVKLKLNTEVCVVRALSRIAEQESGTLMTRSAFTDVNYAHYVAEVEDGDKIKYVNVPRLWLADDRRVEVNSLTYMPGEDALANGDLNLWRGMGTEPSAGDVTRWLDLLRRNVADDSLRMWLVQWFAYPLQHLGAKLNTYLHLFGPPGSGKQALLRPLMRIYGERNTAVIGRENIKSDFNSLYANKQFINLDELHSGGDSLGVTIANKIKMLVTGDTLPVNAKGVQEYFVPNCANVVSTANYSDAIRLDDDDRRAAVVRFGTRGERQDRSYWEAYFRWIDEGGGASAVYDHLLNVDLTGFDPKGWAPMTEEKVEVTRSTRRVDEQWVNALWDDPDQVLPPILKSRCLMSGDELAQYCYGDDPAGVTPSKKNSLGIKLHSAGFPKVEFKHDGRKVRYWLIRRRDEVWTGERAREHLKAHALRSKGK